MTAYAAHKTDPSQQPSPTPKTKFVDAPKPAKENGEKPFAIPRIAGREIVGGVSVPVGAPQSVKDSLERGARLAQEKAERRAKRNRPAKNPRSAEQKEIARLWREYRVKQAYEAYNTMRLTGIEPTEAQGKLVERDLRRERREWNRPPADMMPEPGSEPWIQAKSYARDRMKNGYVAAADAKAGGKYPVGAFSEAYLRSKLSPVLRRFVTDTPKAGKARRRADGTGMQRLMSGPAKDDRQIQWSKLEGLDQSHIALQSVLRGCFRHELDRDFVAMWALRQFIRRKVRERKLACEPHVVVFSICPETGYIQHPHLWWFLPEDQKVLYDLSIKGCRRAPMDLYDGVVNGVHAVLEEIGADAGGLGNPVDGKNPLCPLWHFEVWNETTFPTLLEWSKCVNVHLRRDHIVREQAIMKSGTTATISNQVFSDASRMAWPLLRAAHTSADLEYRALLDDRRNLAGWLFDRLMPAFDDIPKIEAAADVVRIVSDYVAREWDPCRLDPKKRRGRGYANVRGIPCRHADGSVDDEGVLERKKVGGAVGRAIVKADTINLMADAMRSLADRGRPVTRRLVGELVDCCSKTIGNNWKLAVAAFANDRPVEFQCLLRGDLTIPENTITCPDEPTTPTDQDEIPPCAVRGWPGGYEIATVETKQDATPEKGTVKPAIVSTLDPCWSATDAPRHAAQLRPSRPNYPSSDAPSPDRTAVRCPVAEAGDGQGVQRGLPAEAGKRRCAGSSAIGRGDHASDARRGYDADAGLCQANPPLRRGNSALDHVARRLVHLQQRRHQAPHHEGGGRDVAPPRMTYANRRDPPEDLTLAGSRLILFPPFVSRDTTGDVTGGVGEWRHPSLYWLKKRTA